MKNILFSILIVLTFFARSSDACTLQGETISKFDPTEYVFIGKVVGYAKSLRIPAPRGRAARGQASGLLVEVKEQVYLPAAPVKHFEVFPFGLGADCSPTAISRATLSADFPLNSEIRIIAYAAEVFPFKLPGGNLRLEISMTRLGSLALNIDGKGKSVSSADAVFDYESFVYDARTDSDSKALLPAFEIRKDLLRLKNSRTQKERTDILDRLKNAPECGGDMNFQDVLDYYNSAKPQKKLN